LFFLQSRSAASDPYNLIQMFRLGMLATEALPTIRIFYIRG